MNHLILLCLNFVTGNLIYCPNRPSVLEIGTVRESAPCTLTKIRNYSTKGLNAHFEKLDTIDFGLFQFMINNHPSHLCLKNEEKNLRWLDLNPSLQIFSTLQKVARYHVDPNLIIKNGVSKLMFLTYLKLGLISKG